MQFPSQAPTVGVGQLIAWIGPGKEDGDVKPFQVTGKLRGGHVITLAGTFNTGDAGAMRALAYGLVQVVDALGPADDGEVQLAIAWQPAVPAGACRAEPV